MKAISEILDLAIESPDNLPTAMLHTKVLADRLQNPRLSEWVNKELNGYPDYADVPQYRRIRGRLRGVFEKYWVTTVTDDVPIQTLGRDLYDLVSQIILPQSVNAIARFQDDGTVGFSVGMEDELLNLINSHFGNQGRFHRVFNVCHAGSIAIVLADIQQILVTTLSELGQVLPIDAEISDVTPAQTLAVDDVATRLAIHAHGDVYFNSTVNSISQSQIDNRQINIGDWKKFQEFLSQQGVTPDLQDKGKAVLDEIEAGHGDEDKKTQLKEWIQETAAEMSSGVGDALKDETKKEATKLIIEKVKEYAPSVIKLGVSIGSVLV